MLFVYLYIILYMVCPYFIVNTFLMLLYIDVSSQHGVNIEQHDLFSLKDFIKDNNWFDMIVKLPFSSNK